MFEGLPPSIRIGPFDIHIQVAEQFEDEDLWGACDFNKCLIELRASQPSAAFAVDTVLHEITHAIFKIYLLKEGDDEERATSAFATGWTQVLRDNPGLLKWIAASLSM